MTRTRSPGALAARAAASAAATSSWASTASIPAPRTRRASAPPASPRGPGSPAACQAATAGASARTKPSTSLSAIMPSTQRVRPRAGAASRQARSAAAASGLWATSSTVSTSPAMRWKRPARRASRTPRAIAPEGRNRPAARAASCAAATAVAALSSWCGPASPGVGRMSVPSASSKAHCPSPAGRRSNSRPRRTSRAPSSRACASTEAGGAGSPTTAGRPGRRIPAFSRPMASRSGPSHSLWSRPSCVITATSGSTTLTASRRPPSPTSSSATSTSARASSHSAARVPNSK